MALTDRSYLRDLLARHGFSFSRAMGQNFLVNPSICPRMAAEGGAGPGVGVLEIGPGIGVLTAELASRADRVVCLELDERLRPVLNETLSAFCNVTLLWQDALKADLRAILAEHLSGLEVVVCANLPYYITSPLLMRLLEERLPIASITVMVQREAARRLCAPPGTRDCGAVSAAVHYYSSPRRLFSVSPGSFLPAPKVDSEVIRLDILPAPSVAPQSERAMFSLVKAAFAQRRKRAVNAVASSLSLDKAVVEAAFAACGVDRDARAERLTLADFCALSDALLEFLLRAE